MVHTRNGINYSVQADGCGQGRGNTKSRSEKYSSRKTHLEDSRFSPHSPRSAPTDLDVNSESELIYDNISRVEPFSSGSNRNLLMSIQELVHISQRGGVGNMPKPLAGGHELLLTYQKIYGSGEDHETITRLRPIFLQRQDQKKELEMTPALDKEDPVESTSSRSVEEQAQKTSEETERLQEPSGTRKRKSQLAKTLLTRIQDPKLEPSAVDSFFNMARTIMELKAKEQERMNRTFPRK
ncbi:hypothetical protein O181_089557 [Austropuccinia psidii MF-1]|uniref:Uncharacterized protein n=1 Tax=Austropuccinia psidii MF-1 TaxID=1389203 RepID=A0A9Q3ITT2_9BASI|nr:hypothetical protein [Austropuccinia psidii MF-1]